MKREKGITIVALTITIIIIIILSTITLNVVLGDNGLINTAKKTKEDAEDFVNTENDKMSGLLEEYSNIMAEESEIPLPPYVDSVLPTAPEISNGMIPVKWNGSNWVKTTVSDDEWYDYANKEWANVVLGDSTFNEDGTLNEDLPYSMLVWIPRYAYQITSGYHQSGEEINSSDGSTGAANINIVFIDTNNQNKAKTEIYSETYPNYSTGSGMEDYVVHPAFNYGGTKLNGFWVGKYETSHTGCTTDVNTGETNTNVTTLTVQIKAGVTSWRNINISNMFTVCTELNKEGNPYKLNTNDSVVDPHMMKNSEWGAVAYLSQNATYGKGSEVWINPNSNHITGQAGDSASATETTNTNAYNTTNGQQSSTTGNVTGVYDMSGGAHEYVAAYIDNGNSNLSLYGSTLLNAAEKYKDVYKIMSDTQSNNYNNAQPTTGYYGDAVWETSSSYIDKNSWYSDYSIFPASNNPLFGRSGCYYDTTSAGVFYFNRAYGNEYKLRTFRLVLPVLQ